MHATNANLGNDGVRCGAGDSDGGRGAAEQAIPTEAAAHATGQRDAARGRRASPNKRLKLAARVGY